MSPELKLSLASFLLGIVVNNSLPLKYTSLLEKIKHGLNFSFSSHSLPLPIQFKVVEILLLFTVAKRNKLNCFTAYCLGLVLLIGVKNIGYPFGLYLMVLSFFHFSEYMTTGLSNPQNLSWDSFLVNHSVQYWVAMMVSWAEHATLTYFLPQLRVSLRLVTYLGCVVCVTGEVIRKQAMLHAGRNFNHLVQSHKSDDHHLVTSGIYAWCRHPSYVGWFLWSLGTQILLLNPICFLLYAFVSFTFFKERIYVEEFTLISFFGDQYRHYQKRVGTGIPGIQGYHGPVMWGERISD